jgi:hypothetical protein
VPVVGEFMGQISSDATRSGDDDAHPQDDRDVGRGTFTFSTDSV